MLSGRILALIAVILLAVAWILYVVGNALPSWITPNMDSSGSYTFGLWQVCSGGTCVSVGSFCDVVGQSSCSKVRAAQAFMTLVCITLPFAVGCLIFVVIKNKFDSPFLSVGKGLASVSFVFGIIGMGVGIGYVTQTGYKLGAAAIITIIGVIINLAGSIIAGLSRGN